MRLFWTLALVVLIQVFFVVVQMKGDSFVRASDFNQVPKSDFESDCLNVGSGCDS